jgi:O-antigen/teichoic acid export membrane protein
MFMFFTASANVDVPCSSIVALFIVFMVLSIPVESPLTPIGSQYYIVLFDVAYNVLDDVDYCFTNWLKVQAESLLTSISIIGIPIDPAKSVIFD